MTDFSGYAARFDVVDRGADIIRRGAFVGLPHVDAVPLLYMHRSSPPAGKILRLYQDDVGLFVLARIENEFYARRFRGGQLRGLSIGYRTADFRRHSDHRELLQLRLVEISLVEHPMQPLCLAEAA